MADYEFVISTGTITVDTSATLAEVQAEYRTAFNDQELVVNSGPLSVLINAETEARDQVADITSLIANQINPNLAGGTFLDSLYALFNGQRRQGVATSVIATLGTNNESNDVVVTAGSIATSTLGNVFESISQITIPKKTFSMISGVTCTNSGSDSLVTLTNANAEASIGVGGEIFIPVSNIEIPARAPSTFADVTLTNNSQTGSVSVTAGATASIGAAGPVFSLDSGVVIPGASRSQVVATLTNTATTGTLTIPSLFGLAQTTLGANFQNTGNITIVANGGGSATGTSTWQSVDFGPIIANSGTLTIPIAPTGGVYTITNAAGQTPTGNLGVITGDFTADVGGPTDVSIGALDTVVTGPTGWDLVSNATTGTSGTNPTATGDFIAQNSGSIEAPIGTLDTIVTGPTGWNVVNNTQVGTPGNAGTVDGEFFSQVIGAIPLTAGTLTTPDPSITNWDTVTNALAGEEGNTTPASDAEAQSTRNSLLGAQSTAMSTATIAALSAIDGVKSVLYRENITDSTIQIDGIDILANSIYVNIDGGFEDDILQALLDSKSGGCGFSGDIQVAFIDSVSGQSYDITYSRPSTLAIELEITIDPDASIVDSEQLAKDAILAYAAGEIEGFAGFVLGADVEPFDINDGVSEFNSSLNPKRVEVALLAGTVSTDDITININQQATIDEANITVKFQ